MRKPTPQQKAIFEAIEGTKGHVVVEALAGTGKTSTAVASLGLPIKGRLGFVAFNKHIADELRSRLPVHVRACTMHSLGFDAIRKAVPSGVELDQQKLRKLAFELAPKNATKMQVYAAEDLARLAKYTLALEHCENPTDALADIVEHYDLDIPGDVSTCFRHVISMIDESANRTRTVDFDDMVWLPSRLEIEVDQFDLLFCDESQDFNRAQQNLAKKATIGGRLCPIGDRFQSLYGFSGADCDAIPRLIGELSSTPLGCQSLPMTTTWRCPQSHVALARRLVPTLEAAPSASAGIVAILSAHSIEGHAAPGDMVICRKNAPLVDMAYKIILSGRKAYMRGRDIGKGFLNLILMLKPNSISELLTKLAGYQSREEKRLLARDAPASAFQSLEDRCSCLGQLASLCSDVGELKRFIESLFSDDDSKDSVILSSVHRAKGLEADRVFVLDPDSMPLILPDSLPWERQQEKNIAYVAATRSKREMYFQDRIPTLFSGV